MARKSSKFKHVHLAHLIVEALHKHHMSWPLADTLETAYFFYNPMRATDRLNVTWASLHDMVTIKMDKVLAYPYGLLVHNHPNGVLAPSEDDWKFTESFAADLPKVEYGVLTPDFRLLLYKVDEDYVRLTQRILYRTH